MPFLNWRQKQLGREIAQELEEPARLAFALERELRDALAEALGELFAEGAAPAELRVDLPRGWILFWKPREQDSRLLLSRPAKDEYVATLSLTPEHGRRFAERLRGLAAGEGAAVSEAGESPLAGFSNVEVVIRLA